MKSKMCSLGVKNILTKSYKCSRQLYFSRNFSKEENPFSKTWGVLSREVPVTLGLKQREIVYPEHADVVIIGGGYIGSAAAYWLKSRAVHGLEIVVLEKDTTYKTTQVNYSLGSITQHFSLIENMKLAQYCSEFLRNIKTHLSKDVDVQYCPTGSLVLASDKYADKLEHNVTLMKEEGQRMDLLLPSEIKEQFPWLNLDDVKLGCMGVESEGTFNSWQLLKGYLQKSIELGVKYVEAEVTGFEFVSQRDVLMEGVAPGTYEKIDKVKYRTSSGEERSLKFAACVLAAGHQSGAIAQYAKIGTGDGLLGVPLPNTKREVNVYCLENKADELGLNIPIVSDTSGLWLRREGLENYVLFGVDPLVSDTENYKEDEYYKNIILPALSNRLPGVNTSDIKCIATEVYDCNTFDDTGIVGVHPYYNNLFLGVGFGKLGCQHSPAIGRAIAELIIDSRFTTIDFTRFGFDRLLTSEPVVEFNSY